MNVALRSNELIKNLADSWQWPPESVYVYKWEYYRNDECVSEIHNSHSSHNADKWIRHEGSWITESNAKNPSVNPQ